MVRSDRYFLPFAASTRAAAGRKGKKEGASFWSPTTAEVIRGARCEDCCSTTAGDVVGEFLVQFGAAPARSNVHASTLKSRRSASSAFLYLQSLVPLISGASSGHCGTASLPSVMPRV